MKTLPSKCPITPCPEAQALIEKHDLVYVGVGSDEKPLLPRPATGIGLYKNGNINFWLDGCWNGSASENYYFFSRAEVAKYYKPARVRRPVWTYFCNKGDTLYWVAKITDKTYRDYNRYGSNLGDEISAPLCRAAIANGTYKTLTRAEFLAALKKFGVKEDGTKIAPKTDHKAENARLAKEVETLKEELAKAKADISHARELATKIVELS